jgi:type II secretory pathway pseudopilin PulG
MMGNGPPDQTVAALSNLGYDSILDEARARFKACTEWESTFRKKYLDDLKFADADSYNGHQWPDDIRRTRDLSDKPCLTLNVVRQHNLKIINDMRKSKESVRILGMGNGATQESANIMKQIIRHIEYTSKAQRNAYTPAREFQVKGGIGWWRIVTDYESNDSFDQEIYIEGVPDPLSVYMDPDCQKPDCSDGRFAFVFSFLSKELIEAIVPEYPWELGAPRMPIGIAPGESFFIEKDHWLVCEYFRKVPIEDRLISFMHMGERITIRESRLPREAVSDLLEKEDVMVRKVVDQQVEWKLIVGDAIVDETIWPGSYIPLIRCVGEEHIIEGKLDRRGHTRALTDAQRMFNYNASASVEYGALQTKAPWVAAASAIEGMESMWNTANTENHSVLVWKHVDDDNPDTPIPPPQRIDPPSTSPAFEQGMQTAFTQMMMTSGQWQNQQGQMGNERTGEAIDKRLQAGESATYHFVDNYEDALIYTYQQILDLIPKVYDTMRVKHILADDGLEMEIQIDPRAAQAFLAQQDNQGQVLQRIFNPQMGKYDVAASVGPSVTSKREEAVEKLGVILTEAPALTAIIGDILVRNMDFDDAQEASMRLRRLVPPQALGQGPSQQEQQLMQQIQQLQAALTKAMQQSGKDQLKLIGKDQLRDIDVYEAETDRIKALAPLLPMDQQGLTDLVNQLVSDALETNILPVLKANIDGVTEQSGGPDRPPVEGAQQAPDGEWYILDPTRQTRYLRVGPLAQERTPPGTARVGSVGGLGG